MPIPQSNRRAGAIAPGREQLHTGLIATQCVVERRPVLLRSAASPGRPTRARGRPTTARGERGRPGSRRSTRPVIRVQKRDGATPCALQAVAGQRSVGAVEARGAFATYGVFD